ncbi:hypothetical protein WMY93_032367 [Mugilogobius chulae]|uniref:WDR36/Utp21 N-terminal domain-containing protein n=1 Tax=Mugilogobius chulae TaxID=88201 RepID=A0AAW0MNT4_9GOBI
MLVFAAAGREISAFARTKVVQRYHGHQQEVRLLLPLGDQLISADAGGDVIVWDVQSAELYLRLHFDPATFDLSAIMHPSTYLNKVLLGSRQGPLQLWNIKTSALIFSFSGWSSGVTALEQSPAVDVVGVGTATGHIIVHNIRLDETLMSFTQDWGPITALAFRTDGAPVLASCSPQGHVAFWDLERRQMTSQLSHAHRGAVAGATFVHGEPLLVTNGGDNALRAWLMEEGGARLLRCRQGHSAPPTAIRHHGNDGKNILSAGLDGTLQSFSTVHERFNKNLGHGSINKKKEKKKKHGLKHEELRLPPITCRVIVGVALSPPGTISAAVWAVTTEGPESSRSSEATVSLTLEQEQEEGESGACGRVWRCGRSLESVGGVWSVWEESGRVWEESGSVGGVWECGRSLEVWEESGECGRSLERGGRSLECGRSLESVGGVWRVWEESGGVGGIWSVWEESGSVWEGLEVWEESGGCGGVWRVVGGVWRVWEESGECGRNLGGSGDVGGVWRVWEESGECGRSLERVGGVGACGRSLRVWEESGECGRSLERVGGVWRVWEGLGVWEELERVGGVWRCGRSLERVGGVWRCGRSLESVGGVWSVWEESGACGRSLERVGGVWSMWAESGACGRSLTHSMTSLPVSSGRGHHFLWTLCCDWSGLHRGDFRESDRAHSGAVRGVATDLLNQLTSPRPLIGCCASGDSRARNGARTQTPIMPSALCCPRQVQTRTQTPIMPQCPAAAPRQCPAAAPRQVQTRTQTPIMPQCLLLHRDRYRLELNLPIMPQCPAAAPRQVLTRTPTPIMPQCPDQV